MDRSAQTPLDRRLPQLAEPAYAALRFVAGAMITLHGLDKVFGFLSTFQPSVGSQLWIGGVLELVCGAAVALGLYTRVAAFLASGMMAVAYCQFHWKFQFDSAFFPTVNKGEPALLYCFVFFYVACKGSGIWSLGLRPR